MIIVEGGRSGFDGLVYGIHNEHDTNFFRNQATNMPQMIGQYGEMFKESTQNLFDRFHGSQAIQLAKLAIHHATQIFKSDGIRSLFDTVDFQTAGLVMQRWVMANPTVRTMYHNQQCDGYSDTYVDRDPGKVGDNHYDYRRVMNGIAHETGDNWQVNIYSEELRDGDTELMIQEQATILQTWDILNLMFKRGYDDLTNQYGGKL